MSNFHEQHEDEIIQVSREISKPEEYDWWSLSKIHSFNKLTTQIIIVVHTITKLTKWITTKRKMSHIKIIWYCNTISLTSKQDVALSKRSVLPDYSAHSICNRTRSSCRWRSSSDHWGVEDGFLMESVYIYTGKMRRNLLDHNIGAN